MLRNNFDFSLLINGNSVKEYEHQGQVFVEGKQGTEFSIRLKNNTHKRCLAVITVDGKSIIDGAPGNIDNGGGYVVEAYSSATIPGWRLDNNNIAKFVFSSPEDSYVAQSDDEPEAMDNIGVIGCAVFYEQETIYWNPNLWRDSTPIDNRPLVWYGGSQFDSYTTKLGGNTQSGGTSIKSTRGTHNAVDCSNINTAVYNISASSIADSGTTETIANLGTGFGNAAQHTVSEQSFTRCAQPETVFTVYYDTRKGLEARGVNLKANAYICPSPFPASKGRGCKPPLNWNNNSGLSTSPYKVEISAEKIEIKSDAKLKINENTKKIKKEKEQKRLKNLIDKQVAELKKIQEKLECTDLKIELDDKQISELKKILKIS